MRGIPLPDREEDFTADPSELFFDLVYVFAFSRLVSRLILDPDWDGVGRAALLFAMMWVPWSTFTWSANAVAGNSRPVRLLFMVATVAAVGMAGSVDTAFGDGAPIFAVSVSIILIMALFTMLAGTANEPTVRASIVRYSIPNMVAVAAMVIGALLDGDAQIVAWIGGVACVAVGMARAGSSEWVVRPGHFAERHGLLVIVALGEVIVAIGAPVVEGLGSGHGLPGRTVAALLGAGVFAGLLWWSYFDRPNPAVERRHDAIEHGIDRGRFARDVYTIAHFPIIGGVLLAAVALEEITAHPADPLPAAFRWMLFAGLALYLGGVVATVARAFRALAVERSVALPVLLLVVLVGAEVDGIALLAIVNAVLAVMLIVEHHRIERFGITIRPRVSG